MSNEPNATFKRDGTAVLSESPSLDDQLTHADSPPSSEKKPQSESPVQVMDPALLAMSPKSTPGTLQMQLFFILGVVQTLPLLILADSGSVRNLIDESVYNRLPFAVLPVALGSNLIWHEFVVVPNLPLEVLVGADVLAPHLCSLLYLKNNKKRLQFGIQVCPRCLQYRTDSEVGFQKHLRFVDRSLKRNRNRLKVGYKFLAIFQMRCATTPTVSNSKKLTKVKPPRSDPNTLSCIRLTTLATPLLSHPCQLSF